MKVAVIGANGQLGTDICKVYRETGNTVLELNHDRIEIAHADSCSEVIKSLEPNLLINTAAMHNLELCEKHPQHSYRVNAVGAKNLALISNELSIPLIHVSTDYVFDGLKKSPYVENDIANPLNVYGHTKLSGEDFVRTIAERHFVVRVSALYGQSLCRAKRGLNFVSLMLKLAKEMDEVRVVDDEIISPTYTLDLAKQLEKLADSAKYGLYHVSSEGSCSWYEFAHKIFELSTANVELNVALPEEFPSKVPRPKFSVLENNNLKEVGIDIMPNWAESLAHYLDD